MSRLETSETTRSTGTMVEANAEIPDALLGYPFEQGLSAKEITTADLFAPHLLER